MVRLTGRFLTRRRPLLRRPRLDLSAIYPSLRSGTKLDRLRDGHQTTCPSDHYVEKNDMKSRHWIIFIVAVVVAGGFLLWPKLHTEPTVYDELTGRWYASGTGEDGYQWHMEYEFQNGNYTLTTDSAYREEGGYRITKRYLDGSIEVEKTWDDGGKIYTMIILTTEDPDVMYLEGVRLERID